MLLPGAVDHNASGGWRCGNLELGFFYAHSRYPPDASSAANVAAEVLGEAAASTHTQASGVRISPVGTQAQVTPAVMRMVRSLLYMVPPFLAGQARPGSSACGADRGGGTNHRLGRGESAFENYRLTRSIHRSYAVMSGGESSLAGG